MRKTCFLFLVSVVFASVWALAPVSSLQRPRQVGRYVPISVNDTEAIASAQFAVDQINLLLESTCYLKYSYFRLLKAYRQTVSGYNLFMEIETNTSMSGLCHVHFTSGLEILKNVVVYHHWDGTETLSEPADKDEIVYSMETCTLGQACKDPERGCISDAVCLSDSTSSTHQSCQARVSKGQSCELNGLDDECEIGLYCYDVGNGYQCMQGYPT